MKEILFGIALILFGFNLLYVSIHASLGGLDLIGLCLSVIGLVFAIVGVIGKEEK